MEPFKEKVWLARPYMHKEELEYIHKAFEDNWITTAGENIDALEEMTAKLIGGCEARGGKGVRLPASGQGSAVREKGLLLGYDV